MHSINCEYPVILLNHEFKNNLSKYRSYSLNGYNVTLSLHSACEYQTFFPYKMFSPRRTGVNFDNIDNYYLIDKHTGSLIPMYVIVPCNKCLICRDKKAREWSFRATCENNYSLTEPLFLTLTYNNKHLPTCGIFKEELQLFLKRLRRNLDRLNITHNIRYFACGEYGTLSQRPHYHMILWNFPKMNSLSQKLRIIEKSWSLPTTQYHSDGSPISESIGFAYCVPCTNGAISYVMKYMRKLPTIPLHKNSNFFLSSRKNGGIGAAYAREKMNFYRSNPHILQMEVLDKYSNKLFSAYMPTYYKNLIFPSNSKLLSKETRDNYKMYLYRLSLNATYYELLDMPHRYRLTQSHIQLIKQFSYISNYVNIIPDKELLKIYDPNNKELIISLFNENNNQIDDLYRYLSIVKHDTDFISIRTQICQLRKEAIDEHFRSQPQTDINYSLLTINNRNNNSISKEKL